MEAALEPGGVSADLSGDGRYVAFASSDPELLPRDDNAVSDGFVRTM